MLRTRSAALARRPHLHCRPPPGDHASSTLDPQAVTSTALIAGAIGIVSAAFVTATSVVADRNCTRSERCCAGAPSWQPQLLCA